MEEQSRGPFAHIIQVFFVCTQKQVRWIDAGRVVAMMTNMHTVRDRAVMNFVTVAVGVEKFIPLAGYTVSGSRLCSLPFPTASGLIHANFRENAS